MKLTKDDILIIKDALSHYYNYVVDVLDDKDLGEFNRDIAELEKIKLEELLKRLNTVFGISN